MLIPMSGKLILKEYAPKNNGGIYMSFKKSHQYIICETSDDERVFEIGDIVIVNEENLFEVALDNEIYFIADTDKVAAKVVKDE